MSKLEVSILFKNKNSDGSLNTSGKNIKLLRKELKLSQRKLADKMQLLGIDLSKNAIQQIESGERFITDIELKVFAKFFGIPSDELLE
ncbi:MAG: helix-turn-helix domain-containing protein [Defluviitaleaceae bacterium]|nr:helix-turn-helix domain-containing protein [Defluviitaleaceae bacterium]